MCATAADTKGLSRLFSCFGKIKELVEKDAGFQASSASTHCETTFGIRSSDSDTCVLVKIQKSTVQFSEGSSADASFTLSARPDDWQKFFQVVPPRPHQSYWGILRVLGHEDGIEVQGDTISFGRHARLWRIILDRARDALHDTTRPPAEVDYTEDEESSIVGRYTTLTLPSWGKSKIFYDAAGSGPQTLLFLHTAGADSRQFHALMDTPQLQRRCTMYAFDLPGHGRSYPGSAQQPQGYSLTEEMYVSAIGAFISKLHLTNVIVSGASMAGHVCLALALRASELGIKGVIPCEGCAHLPFTQPIYEIAGDVDEAVLNPERVCGMIAPGAPEANKRLIWWIYSSQATGVFQGDLKFYFVGWNGTERLAQGGVDTRLCPVYMLTGEFDYSCTAEMSEETSEMIRKGQNGEAVRFEKMEGLGHFPMTEDPQRFLVYLVRGLDFIQKHHEK